MQRSAILGTLKWIGSVVCAVTLVVTVASYHWLIEVAVPWSMATIGLGRLFLGVSGKPQFCYGFSISMIDKTNGVPMFLIAKYWTGLWGDVPSVSIPLLLPVLLMALPTAFLWWHGSRVLPGHCRGCGYDLTGNVSGRCPECGQQVGRCSST